MDSLLLYMLCIRQLNAKVFIIRGLQVSNSAKNVILVLQIVQVGAKFDSSLNITMTR